MLPRWLTVLGVVALLFGMQGAVSALVGEIVPCFRSHDSFVSAYREELERQNHLAPPAADEGAVAKAGDSLGEKAWTRRFIHLPLGAADLVLSAMLFIGAARALARSRWGHGAWQFAARLKVPFAIVGAAVRFVEAGDRYASSLILNGPRSLEMGLPAETLAHLEVAWARALDCLIALALVAFYAFCAIALAKPKVKTLFTE